MRSFPTDFYFLGERDYVHGPTILGSFLSVLEKIEQADAKPAQVTILTSRLRRFIRENGTVAVWGENEQGQDFDAARLCASATVQRDSRKYQCVLLREDARPIHRRVPYDEKAYLGHVVPDFRYGGTGELQNLRTQKDLIRAIVAFNKRVHEDTEKQKPERGRHRWIVSSFDSLALPGLRGELPGAEGEVRAEIVLSCANVWSVEGRLYTIAEGQWLTGGGTSCKFRIGFVGEGS